MKKVLLCISMLLALVLLAACGGGTVPDGMDKDKLETLAKELMDAVNARDYDRVVELYFDDAGLTAEDWAATLNTTLDALGAFEEYKNTAFLAETDDTLGEIAQVLLEVQYANQKLVWRIVFNTDYEIIGMWA